jgi:NAD(P)-dependent dehydrogenase (short-subunit alcohol dehydrogenase family)
MDTFSLEGKVAVVTGGLGLLGREHCHALSEAGAKVIVADLDENICQEFADTLPTDSRGIFLDVTEADSIKKFLQRATGEFGQVEILVNNAGINDMFENPALAPELSKFENYPLQMWKKMMDVNVTGVFLCSQVIGGQMAGQGRGSIINIASTYGVVAPDQSIYCKPTGEQQFYKSPAYPASKGAVLSLTRFLASYWGRSGVRVNALSPGGVENSQPRHFIENYSRKTPLCRMAKRSDYRGAIVFLASDASGYMTGANMIVDGGLVVI